MDHLGDSSIFNGCDQFTTVENFRLKPVAEWLGEECLQWARNVLHRHGYLQNTNIDLRCFLNLTGNYLLTYDEIDFSLLVGHEFSALFYSDLKEVADLMTYTVVDSRPPEVLTTANWPNDMKDNFTKQETTSGYIYTKQDPEETTSGWEIENDQLFKEEDLFDISYNPLVEIDTYFESYEGFPDMICPGDIEETFQDTDLNNFLKYYAKEVTDEKLIETCETAIAGHNNYPVEPQPCDVNEQPTEGILEKITTPRKKVRGLKNWEFLMRLLADPRTNPTLVEWEDEERGIFRLRRPEIIAQMWASRRGDSKSLSYNNFARGLRHHYKAGTLIPFPERHLVYKCGPKALEFLQSLRSTKEEELLE